MKTWTLAAAAAALALAACTQPAKAPEAPAQATPINVPSGAYTLDPHHTTVAARVKHFGLSNYVLRLNGVTGALTFNAEDPALSTIEATVAVNTLDTPYAGDRDFDAELQNSEWLDALNFPTATFRSTSAERTGPNTGRVTGDLTIRGVTHPATFEVTYNASHAQHPMGFPTQMIGFSATTTFLRSQYGFNGVLPESAPGAGDGVADQIELLIEAEFTRPVESNAAMPAEPVD
jgi:polyisoprenoid-binding protein YceI